MDLLDITNYIYNASKLFFLILLTVCCTVYITLRLSHLVCRLLVDADGKWRDVDFGGKCQSLIEQEQDLHKVDTSLSERRTRKSTQKITRKNATNNS